MKKHLRLILMAIIAMIVPLAASAQEDVTATYLLNPGFEEGPGFFHDSTQVVPGWNISKENLLDAFRNTNDGATPPEGLNVFGIWSPGSIGDFEISQTVANLPAGTYTISCVLTTTKDEYTTQRLFASTPSAGTKALYYESSSSVTIAGEQVFYAGYPDDGNGNGPFRPMTLKIKVAAGESLVFGIRSNGTQSILSPGLTSNGNFKVDNFTLHFIADDVAYTKAQIQEKLDLIKVLPTDTLPGGYFPVIEAKIAWSEAAIASQTNIDSLDLCLVNLSDFLVTMKASKTKYINLGIIMRKCEDLTAEWVFTGKDILDAVYDEALNTLWSNTALNADFDKAYADLDAAIYTYSVGRIPEDLAKSATLSTSYVSPWEKLSAIIDGYEPANSRDKGPGAYGNWDGSNGKTNWVQFEWPTYMNFQRFDVYWWYDGGTPDGGGITRPLNATLEYFKDGAWVLGTAADTSVNHWNKIPFVFKTNKIRLTMTGTVATGILEVKIMGLGKIGPDVSDYKMLIGDELIMVNAMNQDSLPKGYASTTATIKAESETLLLGTDSLGLIANYTALKARRQLLETGTVAFKALNKTLNTTNVAIGASTSTELKPRLQTLYDNGLAVLTGSTSMNDTIVKTNTALNNYLSLNTRLNSSKAALDRMTSAVIKPAFQYAFDRAVTVFTSPAMIDSVVFYTTSMNSSQRLSDTLAVAESLMAATSYTGEDVLLGVYNTSLAVLVSKSNVAATLNTARTTLSAALLAYNLNKPVGIDVIKRNDFVNVYPTSVKRGNMITIDFSGDLVKPASVEMFMISGQKVYKTTVSDKTSSVRVPSSLASGIYLMVFDSPEGKTFKKIVVE